MKWLFTLFCFFVFIFSNGYANSLITLYQEANLLFQSEQYPQAKLKYEAALEQAKNNPASNRAFIAHRLGNTCFVLQDWTCAQTAYQQAVNWTTQTEAQQQMKVDALVRLAKIAVYQQNPYAGLQYLKDAHASLKNTVDLHPALTEEIAILDAQLRHLPKDEQAYLHIQPGLIQATDYYHLRQGPLVRWGDHTKRITVFVKAGSGLTDWDDALVPLTAKAFEEWSTALGNRFTYFFTTDPKRYDMKLTWLNSVKSLGIGFVEGGSNRRNFKNNQLSQNDIEVALHSRNGERISKNEIYATLLHEIGHSLGISWHSDHVEDVLYGQVMSVNGYYPEKHLSQRDINTIRKIYQARPDITNPRGNRFLSEIR